MPLEERDPFLVLSVGRLVDVKGFRYAIEAFKEVVKRVPQARYLIVGNGPERLMLEGLIRSYGLTGSVELAGEKVDQEVMALYQKASIFVLPAIVTEKGTEEGQGLVLQEAQACGIPVVASRIGGIPEGVLDGTSGFLVPPKDPSTLAEKIIHLLEHPDLRKKMGEGGRTFIQDRFTMDSLAEKWEHLYHAIL